MQHPAPIAGRWLGRALVLSIVLYSLLLVVLWPVDQHRATSEDQHPVQLFRTTRDLHPESIGDASSLSGQVDVRSTATLSMHQVNVSTRTNLSSGEMLKAFLHSDGPSTSGIPHYTCVGWRQTGGCSPDGPLEPENDADCNKNIKAGASGYCLLRDDATGDEVQAMRVNCTSLRKEVRFNCRQAADFARVAPQIDALIAVKDEEERKAQQQDRSVTDVPKNGVLMVMYPKVLESVYATIRLLRSYDCKLLVELWYLESEMGVNPLNNSRVLQSLVQDYGPISLRGIADGVVGGFNSKVFALAHSALDQVLFLDADNAPIRDPTYLFTLPEFVDTGALFWPDFWHPKNTIFNINAESPIWELIGTPYADMFEQESGQLLIDRRRAGVAMEIVQFLALREPDHFERLKLLHGDKDLFRLAWLKTKTPFHMIKTPAGAAGMVKSNQFCGMTMVQHDPLGHVLFLHHNGKKLIGEAKNNQTRVWTHLQSFVFPEHLAAMSADADQRHSYLTDNYHVRIYGGSAAFPGFSMCYGDNRMKSKHYKLTEWGDLAWHDLEDRLNDFAKEASTFGLATH